MSTKQIFLVIYQLIMNKKFISRNTFLVTVFCRTDRVCEFCPVNKLTFSR